MAKTKTKVSYKSDAEVAEKVATLIKGMSPESVKMIYKVANDIVFYEGLRNECK